MSDVLILGGGAAGMMAALTAAHSGASAAILEPNEKLGRKLYISGKGRCNLTNDCSVQEALQNIPGNPRFLYSAMERFSPAAVQAYFTALGVPLKTERGNRVFPASDRAADVIDALWREPRHRRVPILRGAASRIQLKDGAVAGVAAENGFHACRAVVLATGGVSYPATGSTGDGYRMAAELGHSVIPPRPSLVPLEEDGTLCARMQGLSLRNVAVRLCTQREKLLYQEQGELLFTHFGLSGPLILSASAHLRGKAAEEPCHILIDLKPALDEPALDRRLVRELAEQPNRSVRHALESLLPRLMVPVAVQQAALPPDIPANSVTREQRRRLLETLKAFRVDIRGPRPVEEAIVTAGGVKTGEVDPRTMMSKLVPGLFFAGEVLDVDAYTGGFNLQIAWCTGHAGQAAAQYCGRDEL